MSIAFDPGRPLMRDPSPQELLDDAIEDGDYFGVTGTKYTFTYKFVGSIAKRLGVHDDAGLKVADNQTLRQALDSTPAFNDGQFTIHKLALPPGAYYKRIARPHDQHPEDAPGTVCCEPDVMINSLNQMRMLVNMLDNIFQSVHPDSRNFGCFSTSLRNLLILASTECEAQWKGVLKANGYEKQGNLNRNDYVKLLPAMRLGEYGVAFRHYPWLDPIAPFLGWSAAHHQGLFWYENYNAVKHDREREFDRANLRSAVNAVAACWAMIAAQFGHFGIREFTDLRDYFVLTNTPRWRYSDVYTHPYDGYEREAGARNYPFA